MTGHKKDIKKSHYLLYWRIDLLRVPSNFQPSQELGSPNWYANYILLRGLLTSVDQKSIYITKSFLNILFGSEIHPIVVLYINSHWFQWTTSFSRKKKKKTTSWNFLLIDLIKLNFQIHSKTEIKVLKFYCLPVLHKNKVLPIHTLNISLTSPFQQKGLHWHMSVIEIL